MKAKMYQTQNGLIYRAEGNVIQVMNPQVNDEWRESAVMMDIARKSNLSMQEALDRKAAMSSWKPWEPPESAQEAQSNAVQLAANLVDTWKKRGGEMTAEGFKKAMGTGGYGDPDLGDIEYDYKGVSIRPEPQRWTREMKFTWAKFIKFCRDNGLIEEKSLKAASKPVSEGAEENPIYAAEDAPTCAPTVSDAQPSPLPSVGVDAKTEVDADDLPEICRGCQCATCGNKDCASHCWTKPNTVSSCEHIGPAGLDCDGYQPIEEESIKCNTKTAPKPAAATTNEPAAMNSSPKDAGMQTPQSSSDLDQISTSGLCSPADCAAASLATASASPAPMAAEFDYTGLDQPTVDTLHLAERMIRDARRDYITKLAQAVYIVHDALSTSSVHNVDTGKFSKQEETFRLWCASVGLGKTTAYKLLQVAALLNGSTPEEQAVLESASPSLLYAAAKPSAPAELVQAVKDGDITTHKEYQALLAQLKAKEQELAAERADREAERASTSALLADEQQRRQEAEQARIAAEKSAQGAKESYRAAHKNEMFHIQRAQDAENQRAMMEEREQIHLARIAELEARPVEVVGADPDEIERRAKALADEKTAALKAELEKERSISEDLAGKLAEANMSLEDSQQENTDSLLLAGVRRTVSLCSMLLAEEFERLAQVDSDDLYQKAVNELYVLLADLDADLDRAVCTGRWPDEKDGEED